jgi:flagellar hook assembly protein FlgD
VTGSAKPNANNGNVSDTASIKSGKSKKSVGAVSKKSTGAVSKKSTGAVSKKSKAPDGTKKKKKKREAKRMISLNPATNHDIKRLLLLRR